MRDAGAKTFRAAGPEETGAAPEARAVAAIAPGSQKHDAAGDLGCARRDEAGDDEIDAAVAGRRSGAASRHAKIGSLHPGMKREGSRESYQGFSPSNFLTSEILGKPDCADRM